MIATRCALPAEAMPFAGAPCAALQADVPLQTGIEGNAGRWSLSARAPGGAACPCTLELALEPPAAILLDGMSFPARWIPAGTALELPPGRLAFSGPRLTPLAVLEPPAGATASLDRSDAGLLVRIQGCTPLLVTLAAGIHPRDVRLFRAFARDTSCDEAARVLCALFALLDTLAPEDLGAPLQDHRRILEHLAAQRQACEERGPPSTFRLGPAGFDASWTGRKLAFLRGEPRLEPFPAGASRWDILGQGCARIVFSEDHKGFCAHRYDSYGRPRRVYGRQGRDALDLSLAAGERVVLEEA